MKKIIGLILGFLSFQIVLAASQPNTTYTYIAQGNTISIYLMNPSASMPLVPLSTFTLPTGNTIAQLDGWYNGATTNAYLYAMVTNTLGINASILQMNINTQTGELIPMNPEFILTNGSTPLFMTTTQNPIAPGFVVYNARCGNNPSQMSSISYYSTNPQTGQLIPSNPAFLPISGSASPTCNYYQEYGTNSNILYVYIPNNGKIKISHNL